jgi:hypothetical protein
VKQSPTSSRDWRAKLGKILIPRDLACILGAMLIERVDGVPGRRERHAGMEEGDSRRSSRFRDTV